MSQTPFRRRSSNPKTLLFSLFLGLSALAQQSVEIEGYEIHYSVVPSTFIQPEVAEKHDIVRANNRAVITIAVRHDATLATPDRLTGHFINLISQRLDLDFRLIEEGDASYYLATFLYTHDEPLTFHIQLHVEEDTHEFSFDQPVSPI